MDGNGNLYGTTYTGGPNGLGNIFELAQGSGTITTLAAFNGPNGMEPQGGMIMDASGNLYGTTRLGGTQSGTVFELAQGSSTITDLVKFNCKSGGYFPYGGVLMDASGDLYGTTSTGGGVFEIAHGSGTFTVLAPFNGSNGSSPKGAPIMDAGGNLYGTTTYGGAAGDGTVFELVKGSGTITALATFNGSNGSNPWDPLIMDGSGNLYGTTYSGGAYGGGTVFEVTGAATPSMQRKGSGPLKTNLSDINVFTTAGAHPLSVTLNPTGTLSPTVTDTPNSTIPGKDLSIRVGSTADSTADTLAPSSDQVPWSDLVTTLFEGASGKRDIL
jgi:uncharacterized repeat protein (TIGR03803 family)